MKTVEMVPFLARRARQCRSFSALGARAAAGCGSALLALCMSCQPTHQTPPASAETFSQAEVAAVDQKSTPTAVDEQGQAVPGAPQKQRPPAPGPTPAWNFPGIAHATLDNGLQIRSVERPHLPILELRLVVKSGAASTHDQPGLAALAGEMLKVGGAANMSGQQLLDRVESLGSRLSVLTDQDSTQISLSVTADHLQEAIDVLAAMVRKPRFDGDEFRKLKRREVDRVNGNARSSARWAANMALYQELFELPSAPHPYAYHDATAKQLEPLTLADCKRWHEEQVTPQNSFLVLVGDIAAQEAQKAVAQAFDSWQGGAPKAPFFSEPLPRERLRILLVDRPDSPQAEVLLAVLGPARRTEDWPAVRVANQILGGGVSGRLFLDIREKRSLAYRTYASIDSNTEGPVPIVLAAGTQTAKAALALQGLLEHLDAVSNAAPTSDEVAISTRYLTDVFLLRTETAGEVANLTLSLGVYGFPDDYYDQYRQHVRVVTPEDVLRVGNKYYRREQAVAVVAGDAKLLSAPLSHFGKVRVIDPEKEFATRTLVPYDPTQPVELERQDGT